MAKNKEQITGKRGQKAGASERRNSRRFNVNWEAVVEGTDIKGLSFDEAGALENLSSTGAFLYLGRQLELGAKVDLSIRVPSKRENWMKYSAEVVRVESGESRTGIAIRFDAPRPVFLMK